MSSTINLQQTMNWALPYIDYQPLDIGGMEPALTNANIIRQTILGPPFSWPWNRVENSATTCEVGEQDYQMALSDFGFLETAWITLGGKKFELKLKRRLSQDGSEGRPEFIAVQLDDNNGNITFRISPQPSQAFTLTVVYQRKALPLVTFASRWDPIPDELSYIVNPGFLALSMPLVDNPEFATFNDRFIAHLLSAQDGLDEMQRNIFIANWLDVTKQIQRSGLQVQQGTMSRQR